MAAVIFIFLFIFGTFVGSFLNLVSDRLPKGKKIVFGRSECEFCHKPLGVKNLIPVFSFIFQKGKCSFCEKKLSYYYPFSELFTGAVFLLAGHLSGFLYEYTFSNFSLLFYYSVVFSFYVAMFLTDIKFYLILDSLLLPAVIFVFFSNVIFKIINLKNLHTRLSEGLITSYLLRTDYFNDKIFSSLKDIGIVFLGALAISLFFLFLIFITKGRGMGFGDVKLGFLIGLVNGFPYDSMYSFSFGFIAIFLGFTIGAVFSLSLIFMKKKTMKDTIAFGPFLILGSLLTFLFGPAILSWYARLGSIGSVINAFF
jgi:leader peptidase (prepilin peptidase)/N-methyltransferase